MTMVDCRSRLEGIGREEKRREEKGERRGEKMVDR
jgi:hypothetical protein